MIADVTGGLRDAVLVYNLDRLHRRPVELEEFVTLCEKAGVREVATVTADIDLGNDDGLFMARIFAAFAAKESGRRSARIRRKMDQNATAGLPHGPAREDDKITIRETEAAIIRVLVDRFLAGESVRSLASWLTTTGVATPRGGDNWKTGTLRQMLCSARLAGLREHRGAIVGNAVWAPIITVEKREQILARFASRAASGRRAPRTHLLSGLLRCGKCGNTLYSASRQASKERRSRRYVCLSGPDHGGCGRLTVVSEPVEALISEAVLTRLDSRELADALSGRSRQRPGSVGRRPGRRSDPARRVGWALRHWSGHGAGVDGRPQSDRVPYPRHPAASGARDGDERPGRLARQRSRITWPMGHLGPRPAPRHRPRHP